MDLRTLIEGHSRLDPATVRAVFVQAAPWLRVDAAVSEGPLGVQVQVRPGELRVASLPALGWLTVHDYSTRSDGQLGVSLGRLPSLQRLTLGVDRATIEEPLPVTRADLRVRERLSGLANLPDVERLRLSAAHPDLERLSPRALRVPLDLPAVRLADPARLQHLDLLGAATTLGGIERFPDLRRLDIADCAVRDLWPLLGLGHLEVLDVRDVQADLEPLTMLPTLKLVAVAGCRDVPAGLAGRTTSVREANLGALVARATRAWPAAAALARVGSLLLAEDPESIAVACDAIAGEGADVSDWLLEGVSPTHLRSMHLHPAPSARAYHLLALARLLAQAPPGSVGAQVRDTVEHVEAWFPAGSDAPVDLAVYAAFPRLRTLVLHRVTRVVAAPAALGVRHLELGFAPGVEPPPGLSALAPGAVITRSPA